MISSRHRCSAPELAPLPLTAAFKRSFPRITEVLLIQGVVRSRAGRRRGKVTELLKVEWKEKHCAAVGTLEEEEEEEEEVPTDPGSVQQSALLCDVSTGAAR